MAAYEILLLNTAIPQIQAAQSGDTYLVPRDIAINATAIISANSATDALRITQTGAGNAILVEDSANPDSTPFVVTATGNVGIGTNNPAQKLDVRGGSIVVDAAAAGLNPTVFFDHDNFASGTRNYIQMSRVTESMLFGVANSDRMTLDSSGNLGLGVTPSAWFSTSRVYQFGSGGALEGRTNESQYLALTANQYIDNVGARKYIGSTFASLYQQYNGKHEWFTAPSGFGYGTAATSLTATQNGNSYTIVTAGTTDFTLIGAANNNVGTTFTKSGGTGAGTGTVSQNISFTQAMTLLANGNLGIGETNPSTILNIKQSTGPIVRLVRTSNRFELSADNDFMSLNARDASTYINFKTEDTERARITSGGDLLVGTQNTNPAYNAVDGIALSPTFLSVSNTGGIAGAFNRNSDGIVLYWTRSGTAVGNISVTTTATTYNTSSDYRLKENQQPLTGSGAFIDALQPKTWDWKSGGKGVGFIAHEVQQVCPSSVSGEKDAVDEEGKPIMQAMEYGSAEFIANIIAELQSLRARVAQLEQGA